MNKVLTTNSAFVLANPRWKRLSSAFSKNLDEALLCEKKVVNHECQSQKRTLIPFKIQAVADDYQHLSTKALEAFLYISQTIIQHFLTEKVKMVSVASTRVLHMLTSGKDSIYLNQVVTCDETSVHLYDPFTKWESEHWRRKNEPQGNRSGSGNR